MRTAVVMLLSMAAISCAQDKKPESKVPDNTGEKKRLQSVTWDLKAQKLVWIVEHGTEQNGKFVPSGSDRYEITPDDAVMKFENEQRGFTQEEASSLHKLLDTLSLYCAESVIWWDQGEGVPLNGNAPGKKVPTKPKEEPAPSPNRQRVDNGDEVPSSPTPLLVAHANGK